MRADPAPNRPAACVWWAAIALCVLVLSGCLGQRARENVLDPVLTADVRDMAAYAASAPSYDKPALDRFLTAAQSNDWASALIDWPTVRADADRGIDGEADTGLA